MYKQIVCCKTTDPKNSEFFIQFLKRKIEGKYLQQSLFYSPLFSFYVSSKTWKCICKTKQKISQCYCIHMFLWLKLCLIKKNKKIKKLKKKADDHPCFVVVVVSVFVFCFFFLCVMPNIHHFLMPTFEKCCKCLLNLCTS